MSDFYMNMLAAMQREKDMAPVPVKTPRSPPRNRRSEPMFGAAISTNVVAIVAVTPLIDTWKLVPERCAFIVLADTTQNALRTLAQEFDDFVISARIRTLNIVEPQPTGSHRAVGMTHRLYAMLLLRPGLEVIALPSGQVQNWRKDARNRIPRPRSLMLPPHVQRQTGFDLHDRACASVTYASWQAQRASAAKS